MLKADLIKENKRLTEQIAALKKQMTNSKDSKVKATAETQLTRELKIERALVSTTKFSLDKALAQIAEDKTKYKREIYSKAEAIEKLDLVVERLTGTAKIKHDSVVSVLRTNIQEVHDKGIFSKVFMSHAALTTLILDGLLD